MVEVNEFNRRNIEEFGRDRGPSSGAVRGRTGLAATHDRPTKPVRSGTPADGSG